MKKGSVAERDTLRRKWVRLAMLDNPDAGQKLSFVAPRLAKPVLEASLPSPMRRTSFRLARIRDTVAVLRGRR